ALYRPLAVHRLEQDARDARLARPARPTEPIGVGDPAGRHGVAERPRHVLLSEHVGESTGAPAEVQRAAIDPLAHGQPPAGTTLAAGRLVDAGEAAAGTVAAGSAPSSAAAGSATSSVADD